jgi:hypothetical protein
MVRIRRTGERIPNSREDLSNSLKLIPFPLLLARSSFTRPLLRISLHLTQVDAIPPNIPPWRISRVVKGMGKQTPKAFAGRAQVCRCDSKSDSRSEGSEGGSWSSCVRDAADVFSTWASSARSRVAGVSSVTAYTV